MIYNKPIVSVVMITYGHEEYIKEAIEGVLMQNCDFDVEVIVADDQSPDQTEKVVHNIITTHPNGSWIKYTKHSQNKGMNDNFLWATQQATGKYIALCEGDDYWSDPLKLQKQVDFLEENEEYGLVCTQYKILSEKLEKEVSFLPKNDMKFEILDILNFNIIGTVTSMFRTNLLQTCGVIRIDFELWCELLINSKGYYMADVSSTYRVLENSASGRNNLEQKISFTYLIYSVALKYFKMGYINDSIIYKRFEPYVTALKKSGKYILYFQSWLGFIKITKTKYFLLMLKQLVR